jgi:hypothetical protein
MEDLHIATAGVLLRSKLHFTASIKQPEAICFTSSVKRHSTGVCSPETAAGGKARDYYCLLFTVIGSLVWVKIFDLLATRGIVDQVSAGRLRLVRGSVWQGLLILHRMCAYCVAQECICA